MRVESTIEIPIAVLGTTDFEVGEVDPATVRLSREESATEVEPLGWRYADVGTPLIGGVCACHKLRGDGIDDLEFEFLIEDLVVAFDLESHSGEIVPLVLVGNLMTGEAIEGVDCAFVVCGDWFAEEFGKEIGILGDTLEGPSGPPLEFTYYTAVSDRVTFAIYDLRGNMVAKLQDMDMAPGIYSAVWSGMDLEQREVPAGVYFARIFNSWASDTRKIVLP
jgi:hypothetical protein